MPSILVTPPAAEPVTLAEAKAHLRVTHADDDTLIASLLVSARRIVEARSGLLLMEQEWTCFFDGWGDDGVMPLPLAPIMSVDEVAVFSDEGTKAVIDAAHYFADAASRPARLLLRGSRLWPPPGRAINGIAVTVTAGFGAAAVAVPQPLRQAILVLVAHLYEHRGSAAPPPPPLTLDTLIRPYREVRL